jgi:N utilization substance protein B
VLYSADLARRIDPAEILEVYESIADEVTLPASGRERAKQLVLGVVANLKEIDERLERASPRWRLSRMAAVDRNVLRIAAYELLFEPEIPAEVVIDEAIEIARRYAGEASPAFVNGVLDQLARGRGEDPGGPA